MRVRSNSHSLSMPIDQSQCFMLKRLSVCLDRLLDKRPNLDYETLEMLYWLLGPEIVQEDLIPLATMLNGGEKKKRYVPETEEDIRHGRDFAHLVDQSLRRIHKGEQLAVIDLFKGLLKKRLDQLQYRGMSDIEKNLDAFQQMFGLSELETDICLFFLILSVYEEAQSLLEYHLKCNRYAGRSCLAALLNSTPSKISNALDGRLSRIGILESDRSYIILEPDFLRFLQNGSAADIETEFFKKIEPDPLPLEAHNVEPDVIDHALRLLSPENDKGRSLLLYGNPGVGKTTFAYGLAEKLGLDIYLCKHEGKDKEWQRQAAVVASVNMVTQNPNSLLIMDDCDAILGTRHLWGFFGAYNDKRWLHEVLESEAKIIFIVNDVRFLEESVIRRFSFSIHFKPFSRTQRIQLWKNLLQNQKIGHALLDSQIVDLATSYDTSPGVIEQVVSNATQTALESEEGFYKAITLSLEAHEGLRRGGHTPALRNRPDNNFTIDGLNVAGADLPSLLEELKAFSDYLKGPGNDGITTMSLLFHGPSGTGKSHLARHIAHILDKEAVIKRGSDVLSAYVGETEANIRSIYENTGPDQVLVIDEADSLVSNRDNHQHSWESSFTNEFLNSMEQHSGIQIMTSNRLNDLDSATLRRFNYKLEFMYLKPEGKVIFYERLLAPLVSAGLDKNIEDEVKAIPNLTPGDFKVVKSKFLFKDQGKTSHEAMIAALKEESKTKEIHAGAKAIGF